MITMNHAALMAVGDAPEAGYKKSNLTIEKWTIKRPVGRTTYYGFSTDGTHGALVPDDGFLDLCVDSLLSSKVLCTRPFYYNGVKYENSQSRSNAVSYTQLRAHET